MFLIVDANNFYVSCERVFRPDLEQRPVVVLSNNDGCVVALSPDVKTLGVPRGAPVHQYRALIEHHQITVCSSNYPLYGDMSDRLMCTLASFTPKVEAYSIDEAFMEVPDALVDPALLGEITQRVKQWTGLPTTVGAAPTKTLAKVANRISKERGEPGFCLTHENLEAHLQTFPVSKIWGIGRRLAKRLEADKIKTAWQLRQMEPKQMRAMFSVVEERLIRELRGEPCRVLEDHVEPRRQIMASRSFGRPVTRLAEMEEAVASYAARAGGKLRDQQCRARAIYVSLYSNRFRTDQEFIKESATHCFDMPQSDGAALIRAGKALARKLFRKDVKYHKALVLLLDLAPMGSEQASLLAARPDYTTSDAVMSAMDQINKQFGRNTVFHAAEGIEQPWAMRADHLSPQYTTAWDQLPTAFVRPR